MQTRNWSYLFTCVSLVVIGLLSTALIAEEPQSDYPFENLELVLYGPWINDEPNFLWVAYFSNGICDFFGNGGFGGESGTYTATNDSVFIHISESNFPERIGIAIHAAWWEHPEGDFNFSNGKLLTMSIAESDTVGLMLMLVGVEPQALSWKEVKQLFAQ